MSFPRSFLKKNLLTIFLILLVYSWFFVSNNLIKPQNINVSGADSNITLFQEPDAERAPILDAINNAKQEILVEVYLLSDKEIIQSLIDAKKRGVDVNIMLEEHPFGGGNLNNKTKAALEKTGVSVEWTNSKFTLTHEKAVIIDKQKVFVLNQNLTASSFSKNREFNALDKNSADVNEARNIFVADWERKSFSPTSMHLVISPNNSRSVLTSLIKESKKSIEIEAEVVEDSQIINLLSEKAKNVQVELIIPSFSQIQANKQAADKLSKAGVVVKTLSSPYVHAKLILIDDLKAYIGSINLSSQSMDENRELGIILLQSQGINLLNSTFESDWNKAKTVN